MSNDFFVHPTALVEEGATIGARTRVWHHAHVRAGASLGSDCVLGKNAFVDNGVTIGNGVKVQNNVSVYAGVTLEDAVFVGPSAVFTNDLYPRADNAEWDVVTTLVQFGASIGANATLVCGITVGSRALIAAGSVVIRDVLPYELVVGNPARRIGWVCSCGQPVARTSGKYPGGTCTRCGRRVPALPIGDVP